MRVSSKQGNGVNPVRQSVGAAVKNVKRGKAGAQHMLGSAARLDFKGMASAAGEISQSVQTLGRGMVNVTPLGMVVNKVTGGALDKAMVKLQEKSGKVFDTVAQGLANDLTMVKGGLGHVGHGLATGNLGEVAQGVASASAGVAQSGRDFTPAGLARSAAQAAVEVAIETARKG